MIQLASKSRLARFVTVFVIYCVVSIAIRWVFWDTKPAAAMFSTVVSGLVVATILTFWRPAATT